MCWQAKAKIVEREQQAAQLQSQLTSANETIKSHAAHIESERQRIEQMTADNAQFVAQGIVAFSLFRSTARRACLTLDELRLQSATAERAELRANIASLEEKMADKLAALKASVRNEPLHSPLFRAQLSDS